MHQLSKEAEDLRIHVEMCALRHGEIKEAIEEMRTSADRRLTRIERVIWGLLALLSSAMGVGAAELWPLLRMLNGIN